MRILIADHTTDLRKFEPGLAQIGHEVRVAIDGLAAFRLAREWPPELVLARVDLPRMDGLALVAALQALGQTRPGALTLAGPDGDLRSRTRAQQLGVESYLSLPVEEMDLVRAVWRAGCSPSSDTSGR